LNTAVTPEQFRAAFLRACELDVAVRKPGNVSDASPGHGMTAAQFRASAAAAAGPLVQAGASVGERIESAVRATQAAAGCNTNLGIVLLAAPLAVACEQAGSTPSQAALAGAVRRVLEALSIDDARAAYRAIALAAPAGLGRVSEQDVAAPPTVTLQQAMRLAAPRDRIAQQYASGYADVFDRLLPVWRQAQPPLGDVAAVQHVYLECLAAWADSHVQRKHGLPAAQAVQREAAPWRARVLESSPGAAGLDADPGFAAWDASLKQRGLNPGTSADLTVATALLAALLQD
jgi:triphosphoribosyl-dephospho-CoA synthase